MENLVLEQLNSPNWYFCSFSSLAWLILYRYCEEKLCLCHHGEWKKLHFINCTLRKHQWTVINFLYSFSLLLSSPSIVGKKIGKWEDPKAARGCVVLYVIGQRGKGGQRSLQVHMDQNCASEAFAREHCFFLFYRYI